MGPRRCSVDDACLARETRFRGRFMDAAARLLANTCKIAVVDIPPNHLIWE